MSDWLIRTCGAPGCTVVIREQPGAGIGTPWCRWHNQGRAYNDHQIKSQVQPGPLLSKEEFGIDLFEAIKTQAALRQAERKVVVYRQKKMGYRVKEIEADIVALQAALQGILSKNTIDPADLQRLLAIR